MALLDDLVQETSFHRFYLRWLVACWLPVLGVVAIWAAAWLPGIATSYVAMGFASPLELWLLVGLGQWYVMRRYSPHAGRWGVVTFFGGVVATFVWAFTSDFKLRMFGAVYLLGVHASTSMGVPHDSFAVAAVGAAVSGFAIAFLQASWQRTGAFEGFG